MSEHTSDENWDEQGIGELSPELIKSIDEIDEQGILVDARSANRVEPMDYPTGRSPIVNDEEIIENLPSRRILPVSDVTLLKIGAFGLGTCFGTDVIIGNTTSGRIIGFIGGAAALIYGRRKISDYQTRIINEE
jgi:hypothetical protein